MVTGFEGLNDDIRGLASRPLILAVQPEFFDAKIYEGMKKILGDG